jgi:hypothetical protein
MTAPDDPAAPAITVTFTVTLEMSAAQVAGYATAYGINARRPAPYVARDVLGRLEDAAVASYLESEYWIGSFATVTASPPKLRAVVIV